MSAPAGMAEAIQTLQAHLQQRQLQPQRLPAQPPFEAAPGAVWTLRLVPGLEGELALQHGVDGGLRLGYSVSTRVPEAALRADELNLFAGQAGELIAPVQLLQCDEELACQLIGLAGSAQSLCELFDEMHLMQRQALVIGWRPWLALARGQIDLEEATLRLGAALAQARSEQGEMP